MRSLFGDQPLGGESAPLPGKPLAARMRPKNLDEFVGQEDVVGAGSALRTAIDRDELPSMILWGPPGTGKTTLANLVAVATKAHFVSLSAVTAGVADLRRVTAEAAALRREGRRTVLFVDEIHRFNRGQQDAILPHVEDGTITLIGATTENPSFEVNGALLSRARVFVLHSLTDVHIKEIVQRALADRKRGFGALSIAFDDAAVDRIVHLANGDARVALNALEFAVHSAPESSGGRTVDAELVQDAFARRVVGYDKRGEGHYDTISAFIKSIRGSDPDAAIYWLARMIEGGEDPLFIARRLVILASEDVGLADPQALPLVIAAQQAVHFVGMPEGFYPLSHATLYLSCAPKSNSVGRAYSAAKHDVMETRNEPVPLHLRNATTGLARSLDYGKEYSYAHSESAARIASNRPPTVAAHDFRPKNVARHRYLEPGMQGAESELARWVHERYNDLE